jgi:hypothetical protein
MMQNNVTESLREWKRRAMGAVGALLIAVSALVFTAAPAAARYQEKCNYPEGGWICMSIQGLGNYVYAVHVGILVHMSRQGAEAIVAESVWPFYTVVYGDDSNWDDWRFNVPPQGGAWAENDGLRAEFHIVVGKTALDEDDWEDEVYAKVWLSSHITGTRTFKTPNIVSPY